MKIFSAQQIYDADKLTIEKQKIGSEELMERASIQIFNWLHIRLQGATVKIHIFCGIGNNGGDGIAVARHLKDHGYAIEVHVVNYSDKRSENFLLNLKRLKERKIWPNYILKDADLPVIAPQDILIDAIFGIGLNRNPDKWVVDLIQHINTSQAFVLSIDMPSGLYTDEGNSNRKGIIKANYVLSFQNPKLVFFLPESGVFIQHWEVLDIGIDAEYLANTPTDFELIGKSEVLPLYIPRGKFSHKGTFGHALLVGGSYGKMGSIQLSSRACLFSGSGMVTALVPKCGYVPMQTALPEITVLTSKNEEVISEIAYDFTPTVIGIGIGLGTSEEVQTAFSKFLQTNKVPLVIDADAINMLSINQELLTKLPPKTILTPHPKELQRLIGDWKDDFEKLKKAKAFSEKYDCILVIKGANTITIYKNKGYINTTGNPGMATAGSGDVLTGIITGLLAQGYGALNAAIFGIYLHGRAGDLALEFYGYQALTASAIIDALGSAYIDLFKSSENSELQENLEN
jgi:hydroxyethylthiazole kinase-like uncharacterized protein yjeF